MVGIRCCGEVYDGSFFRDNEQRGAGGAGKVQVSRREDGVDFYKLRGLAESSLDEALVNLKEVLDRDSEVLTNQAWDEEEYWAWAEKMDPDHEKKTLTLDLYKISVAYPPFPKVAERSSFLNLHQESSSLLNIISNKK